MPTHKSEDYKWLSRHNSCPMCRKYITFDNCNKINITAANCTTETNK